MSRCFVCTLFLLDCLIARTAWTHTRIFAAELAELDNSGVSGDITIFSARSDFAGTDIAGSVKLRGLKASTGLDECGGQGKKEIKDFCRTYLHKGSACTDAATQGPRDREGEMDPWLKVGYASTDESGSVEVAFVMGHYPDADSDFVGNPFVVYNEVGVRVACGILRQAGLPVYFAKVAQYGVPGDARSEKEPVEGEVMLVVSGEGVLGIGLLRNVEEGMEGRYYPYISKESACKDVPMKTPQALQSFSSYAHGSTTATSTKSAFRFTIPLSWFEDKGELLGIEGKRITIYGAGGAPWSCGVLACSFWPVYTASLHALHAAGGPSGMVTIATTRTAMLGVGTGTNLEKGLSSAGDGGQDCHAANGCGAHVHKGDACADDAGRSSAELQGGHYFSGETDPWASVGYLSTDSAGGAFFHFNVRTTAVKIAGKPFILHDKGGGRIACGILAVSLKSQLYITALEALSDASLGKQVVGNVAVLSVATGVIGLGSVSGLQPNLEESACRTDSAATCGVILYDGTACRDKSALGKPFSALSNLALADKPTGWLAQDPWKSSKYLKTDSSGDTYFEFALTTGPMGIAGKVFVVHDAEGKGVTCGILLAPSEEVSGSAGSSSSRWPEFIVIILVLLIACVGGILFRRSFFSPTTREHTIIDCSLRDSRSVSLAKTPTEQAIELTTKNKSVNW